MKKGSSWKRVFIHSDGKTIDSCTRILDQAGIEFYARQMPIWGSGTPKTRKYETHIFVPSGNAAQATSILKSAELVFA